MASKVRPEIPAELKAVNASAPVPVSTVTVEAFTAPLVFPSSVFKTDAATVVSVKVTASFPRLLIPSEVNAVFASAAAPVNVVTVEASTVPLVFPSNVFKTDAASVVSLIVTASFPRPDNVPTVLAA